LIITPRTEAPDQLRHLPRPERVVQLCRPDLLDAFPPLKRLPAASGVYRRCLHASSSAADQFVGPAARLSFADSSMPFHPSTLTAAAEGTWLAKIAVDLTASYMALSLHHG